MSYLLFYAPGTASLAVHWMLIELGLPFEAELVDIKAERSEAYLKLNPAGRVPTLVVDGTPVSESAALLMLLAERHPEGGFAPAVGSPGRAAWLETMLVLANGLSPASGTGYGYGYGYGYEYGYGEPHDADEESNETIPLATAEQRTRRKAA